MKKIIFLFVILNAGCFAAVDMGPEFAISYGSIQESQHKLGNICVLPSGKFAVIITASDRSGYLYDRKLFSSLVEPAAGTKAPELLVDDSQFDAAISDILLNYSSHKYLISYLKDNGMGSVRLYHLWVSFDNKAISNPFSNVPAMSPGAVHLNTVLLSDDKIVTLWRQLGMAGAGGATYYEILQPNGQSWILSQIPCHYSIYSVQLCLLHSGNFLLNWFFMHRDDYGYWHYPYTEYFEVRNNNGTILHSDSTRDFQYLVGGLNGLQDGGFMTCYWKDSEKAAFAQTFSDQVKSQCEPHKIHGIDDPYAIKGRVFSAELSNGDLAVLWKVKNNNDHYDLGLNIISPSTGVTFSNSRINTALISQDMTPRLLPLPMGRVMICWSGALPGRGQNSIFTKIYNADGSIHTDEFMINEDNEEQNKKNVFISHIDNTVLVCWESGLADFPWQKVDGRFIFIDGTGVKHDLVPNAFVVRQNYPNPFNAQTTIQFDIPSPGSIDIHIYNASGRVIYLNKSFYSSPGQHFINWNGCDMSQRPQPSGVYIIKLTFRDNTNKLYSSVQKIVLTR